MAKQTLKAVTPVGTFTRETDSGYKFVTVWASPRAAKSAASEYAGRRSGVDARWSKDQGYGVTWHYERPTPAAYKWDRAATLVGVFAVEGTDWEPEAADAWKEADDKLLAAARARKAGK